MALSAPRAPLMPALNPPSTRWAAQWGQCRCLQGQDLCNGIAHITPAACTSLCFLLMQNAQEACPGQEEQLPLCSQSSGTPQSQNGLGWIKDHRVPAPCHGQGGGVWLVRPSLAQPSWGRLVPHKHSHLCSLDKAGLGRR